MTMLKPKTQATGYCSYCHQKHHGIWEDQGIGSYEYWGARGTHHDWRVVCSECGEYLTDIKEHEPEYPDRVGEY